MTWWQALLLGLVEGITEYLPVSSTGHLILTAWLLGLAEDPETWAAAFTFNIVIQGGAIAAVLLLYRRRVASMAAGVLGRDRQGLRLAGLLALAFLPAAVLGPFLDPYIEQRLNGPWPVAWALFAGAWLMLGVALWRRRRPLERGIGLEELSARQALLIGLAQCLAMWPGTSRSMMTIVAALLLGMEAVAAAELSFLLGLITLSAATAYKLVTGGGAMFEHFGVGSVLLGFAAAAVSATLAVKWFVGFLNRRGLAPFAWYRLVVAALLAGAILAGWLRVPSESEALGSKSGLRLPNLDPAPISLENENPPRGADVHPSRNLGIHRQGPGEEGLGKVSGDLLPASAGIVAPV
jgi:undecaprenyl-diphosphatase